MQFDSELLRRCWFLAGPTASGKSASGIELAHQLNAEIISLDSMSLYRGMDIGTAKPSQADRSRIEYYLVDVIDPHEEYSLADYIQEAEAIARQIHEQGRVPLFVGGTGLYLRSILRGVFDGPPADWSFRRQLMAEAEQHGSQHLHQQLVDVDPKSAARIHPNDTRRIIRAIEVQRQTGESMSAHQRQHVLSTEQQPTHVYWLEPPRAWLYDRINSRVVEMIAAGLVDEVRGLVSGKYPLSRTAQQALGYKEIIGHLQGDYDLETAIEMIQTRTRQFAKRQHTWFRNLEECRAVPISGSELPIEIANRILGNSPAQ